MDKHLQADGCIHTEIFAVASFNVYLPVRPSVCLYNELYALPPTKKIQIMYWNENSKKSNWLKLQNFIWLLFIFCFRLFLSNGWEVSSAILFLDQSQKSIYSSMIFILFVSVYWWGNYLFSFSFRNFFNFPPKNGRIVIFVWQKNKWNIMRKVDRYIKENTKKG